MGVILFAGGEEGDLTRSSTSCVIDASANPTRRTAYARCALRVASSSSAEGWYAKWAPATSFWFSARCVISSATTSNAYTGRGLALMDGAVNRLMVCPANTTGTMSSMLYNSPVALCKMNAAGAKTVLATSSVMFPAGDTGEYPMAKWDIQIVNYGLNATVRVYLNNLKIIEYTGDVTTDGAVSLDGVRLGTFASNNASSFVHYWSEVIVATVDTRAMTLATLAPAATGNSYAWTNAYSTLNEITLDDTTLAYATAANQVLQTTVSNSTVPGTAGVVSLVINARAQTGTSGGPANLAHVVRTGGADYSGSSQALPSSLGLLTYSWDSNPATSGAWTTTDLTAATFNIGVKSLA